MSKGNTLTYDVNGNRYVICGSNPNGTATGGKFWVYDSVGGGLISDLQPSCPAA